MPAATAIGVRHDYRSERRLLLAMTPAERFWYKVQKSDGCWPWLGSSNRLGYGLVRFNGGGTTTAHRYAYELTHGAIGDRHLLVCHHCDNPPCVRPDHLFLGTSADNMHDAQRKGRMRTRSPKVLKGQRRGERCHWARLTTDDVLDIREAYASGFGSLSELAGLYGIHYSAISLIVNRKRWAHLPDRTLELEKVS